MTEFVILVDVNGNHIGVEEKISVHRKGLLHKAFSIFIFDSNNNMLIQKRAKSKYHFAGLWSNACCSHPRPGESSESAAHRRIKEELGFDTSLTLAHSFIYKVEDPVSGLTEHEYDELFIGIYDGEIYLNPQEVEEIHWISIKELDNRLKEHPEQFTFWFIKGFEQIKKTNF